LADAALSIFPEIARLSASNCGWNGFLADLDGILTPHGIWIATQMVEGEAPEAEQSDEGQGEPDEPARNVVRVSFNASRDGIARADQVQIEAGQVSGWKRLNSIDARADAKADVAGDPKYVLGTFGLPEQSAALMVGVGSKEECDDQLLFQISLTIRETLGLRGQLNRLSTLNDCASQVLDGTPYGVVFLDESGRILSENRVATDILNGSNGLYVRNSHLFALSADDTNTLKRAMGVVGGQKAGADIVEILEIAASAETEPLKLILFSQCFPEVNSNVASQVTVVLMFDPARTPTVDSETLMEVFGLTPGEARVAAALAQGTGSKELPALLNITQNTVKTHLKHIFRKTGTSGQSDFIRKLISVPRLFS